MITGGVVMFFVERAGFERVRAFTKLPELSKYRRRIMRGNRPPWQVVVVEAAGGWELKRLMWGKVLVSLELFDEVMRFREKQLAEEVREFAVEVETRLRACRYQRWDVRRICGRVIARYYRDQVL
jgi:hypothetical protein